MAAGLLLSGCTPSGSTGAGPTTGGASSQHTTKPVPSSTTPSKVAATNAPPPAGGRTGAAGLSCADVKQAFILADVAVSSIEDSTAGAQRGAANGTLPYAITLHCVVRLPGVRLPQHVQLDRTPGNSTKLVTALGTIGHSTRLPTAAGYGDVGYVIPQGDGTYALLAGKGNWILDLGDLAHPTDVEHVAHYLLGRL